MTDVEYGYRYRLVKRPGGAGPAPQFEVPVASLPLAKDRVAEYAGDGKWDAGVLWREAAVPPGPWHEYVEPAAREEALLGAVSPQVLADLLSLTEAGMIPPGVISTWTERERERASAWAAAEHLHASDNDGVTRLPMPGCVAEAAELTANPAMAQLAVEGWTACLEAVERSHRPISREMSIALEAARRAVTGLLVLHADLKRPATWQQKATEALAGHPAGLSAADLAVMLGASGPSGEALQSWLWQGQADGRMESPGSGWWRLRGVRL